MADAAIVPDIRERPADFADLKRAAASCTRCPLYKNATQTVFGEGPVPAAMVLVGEQPGDKEDLTGHPFVGPAGAILDQALERAGIDRGSVYVTNAVKHFKNEPRGKRRLHKRPNQYEISRCRWWLEAELALTRPRYVVAMGATAAHALLGSAVKIGEKHGQRLAFGALAGTVTMHPSAILRMRDSTARHEALEDLVKDLATAYRAVKSLA
jgi:DNA polymerase